ncbi:two pore calcium channel protein 1-like isoform X2 [Chrysoperla carnea]|uniref:two pore calcium channel protein 1-like isoform X2 n=1 Tax=Chrysoperla carnea TaxID=189513 RepID=UPI001D095772|nr:two pore calcium channel protein 1-like isoform X2 [Chrysoperla carnea]
MKDKLPQIRLENLGKTLILDPNVLIQSGTTDSLSNDEIGSRSSLNRDLYNDGPTNGGMLGGPGGGDYGGGGGGGASSGIGSSSSSDHHWEMNYHEASIFLEEGANNEKFDSHPRHPEALPAYLLVHNSWYHGLDLAVSIFLLLLAFGEDPAVPSLKLSTGVHATIELLALIVIAIELSFKLRWIGWKTILKHKRTMIKGLTLTIMVIEAIAVLIRQSSHFRVTRALRPIFLADTKACGGVRRFIRQILQSLPPIFDMFGLLLFFIAIYALVGYYLFNQDDNVYFASLSDSFVSLFVLMTTANFPDVMMPSYAVSKWNVLFFISYIATVLYVLMNLMLAVVYETFTRIEREKFKKLLLHKRHACQLAFRMLVSKQTPNYMRFKQFYGLIRYYEPRKTLFDTVLMFKYLNTSNTGLLTLNEFIKVYDACTLRWIHYNPQLQWFEDIPYSFIRSICKICHIIISWKYFENIIYTLIIGNGLSMLIRLSEPADNLNESAVMFCGSWDTILFLSLFTIEAIIRILGMGPKLYMESGWNLYDMTVTILAIYGVILIRMNPNLRLVVIFRPLRLIRLYKMKKRYRDVFGTLVILFPLLCSVFLVMLVVYYFFAIIGMELFAGYDMKNCCVNSTVEDFYKYNSNGTTALGYYYLNNFDDIITSMVTLFELAVVNNWFITMTAYAIVMSPWSRIFFMLFYICMLVVITIIVASVLEAFRFRIQYKRQTSKLEEERMLHEQVQIEWDHIQNIIQDFYLFEKIRPNLIIGETTTFIGRRSRTKNVLQQRMYQQEIHEWLAEADRLEQMDLELKIDEQQQGQSPEHQQIKNDLNAGGDGSDLRASPLPQSRNNNVETGTEELISPRIV